MQICMSCFHELFDSDTECVKCKSTNLLTTVEYKECKQFFMHHEKDEKVYTQHPYSTYLKYLKRKAQKERLEYERLHPSYTISASSNRESSVKPINKPVPKCPTCGSTNVERISTTSKVIGGALFGLFSSNVRNTMHCKNCGYKW